MQIANANCLTFRVVLHPPDKAACVFQQTISPSTIAEKSISLFVQFELKVRVRVISFQFLILKLFYYLDNLNYCFPGIITHLNLPKFLTGT